MKVLVFHPTVAPYRINFFNDISDNYDSQIVLYYRTIDDNKFNYRELEKQFHFSPIFLRCSFKLFGRKYYFGHMKYIKDYEPDVVLVSEFSEGLFESILMRLFFKKKYKIVTICDDSLNMANHRNFFKKILRRFFLFFLDGIVLCNNQVESVYKKYKIPTYIFPIIHNDNDFRIYNEEVLKQANKIVHQYHLTNKRIFLYVGRLSPEKNLPYLVNSFIRFHEQFEENMLFIVGGGTYKDPLMKDKLNKIIDDNNASSYIRLVGRKDGEELKSWYITGQIFVLPSSQEAFGAVVNEALLYGEYVLVSSAAGASCLINQFNGEVIDIRNPFIDFSKVSNKINPLTGIKKRKNFMPVSYKDISSCFIKWLHHFA